MSRTRYAVAAVFASGLLFATAMNGQPAFAASSIDVRGLGAVAVENIDVRVVSVDLAARTVVVERAGHQWRITVPEDAGSLAALRPRDSLQINRVEGALVSAAPAKPGQKPDVSYTSAQDNGLFNGLPARWIVRNITATVKFDSLDAQGGVVSYVGPEGPKTVRVLDPLVVAELGKLKKGDMVTLSFSQATEFVLTPRRF